jgi:hypothetical protein
LEFRSSRRIRLALLALAFATLLALPSAGWADGPTITSVSPNAGPEGGGTLVTITGTGLSDETEVDFGIFPALNVSVVSDTEITATTPLAPPGAVDVTVDTPEGSVTSSQAYVYGAPSVTSVSPTSGPTAGGTSVTIDGSDFTPTSTVDFGGNPALNVVYVSPDQLTATAPATGSGGPVDVTVTTADGTSATGPSDQFTYAPVVSSVSPSIGPAAGGTPVTISGTGFLGATSVTFGGVQAPGFTVNQAGTQITVNSPPGSPGIAYVAVTTPGGTSATGGSAQAFTYGSAPAVTGVSPNVGSVNGGFSVTISGTGFTGATGVAFGTLQVAPANFQVVSDNKITVTAPTSPNPGTADVTVTTPTGGTSSTGSADTFTYYGTPAVTSISPPAGPAAGGTPVTINGQNLAGATSVTFGGTTAAVTADTNTSITAIAPGGPGPVIVVVNTPGGNSSLIISDANRYTYDPVPTVSNVSPNAGTLGTQAVTITGTGFVTGATVMFGTVPATNVNVVSSNEITATAPAQGTSTVDVIVTTPGGSSTPNPPGDQYSYDPIPAVANVSPSIGPAAGGTPVTISGTGFLGATSVTFGGVQAPGFTVNQAGTQITVNSPPGSPGIAYVAVTTPGGTSATGGSAQAFTYGSAPAVTGVSPNVGSVNGGFSVTISGTGFTGATGVAFGTLQVAPANFQVVSDNKITVTAPTSPNPGTADVTVTTPTGGTSSTGSADTFTYYGTPAVTSISPPAGPAAGGTPVTINGQNLAGATSVTFGGTTAAVTADTNTSITAIAPGGPGPVIVVVNTPGGNSSLIISDANRYTYDPVPTVSNVSPNAGTLGTQAVTITGTGFVTGATVMFGTVPATNVNVVSSNEITATAPAQGTSTVDVIVTTPGGSSTPNPPGDQYSYDPVPTVTSIGAPAAGPLGGGNSVTISGTGFTPTSAVYVYFNGISSTQVTVLSSTSLEALAPGGAGTVDITVRTPGGTSSTSPLDRYTYTSKPIVDTVLPPAGPLGGGAVVTISGANLTNATGVSFGGTQAAQFTDVSSSQITVVSPVAASPGTVDVTVKAPGGTSATTSADQYTYDPVPTATAISPSVGPTTGQVATTISGTGFTPGSTSVVFTNGLGTVTTISTSQVTVSSGGTQLTFPSPSSPTAGPDTVTVVTPGGSTSSPLTYTFDTPPTVSSVSPSAGPLAGGGTVTIHGVGFVTGTTVSFGGAPAGVASISADGTAIVATVPSSASSGTVDVTVANPGGTSPISGSDHYAYVDVPSISATSSSAGPLAGGSHLVISGVNLSGGSVKFAETNAQIVDNTSNGAITVVVPPAGSAGTVDITVTTAGGTSATSAVDRYTYAPVPTVTAVSPSALASAGGGTVTITGTGFTGATAVAFGNTAAASFRVVSSTQMTAVVPPLPPGTVDVTVVTPGGPSATSPSDQFTYLSAASLTQPVPVVSKVSPSAGPVGGGISVTITGSHFTGATAVDFGSTPAASFVVQSDSTIVAVTAPHAAGSADVSVTTAGGESTTGSAVSFTFAPVPSVLSVRVGSLQSSISALAAMVDAGGLPLTTCEFQYGRTARYGRFAKCLTSSASNAGVLSLAARIRGLNPATTYHYRLRLGTAAGLIETGDERFTTRQLPLLAAPLVGLLVQRTVGQTSSIGTLLGIEGVQRGVAGETLKLRCVQTCSGGTLINLKRLSPPFAKIKVTLAHAVTLSAATQIEILVSKRGRLGRYAVYAFAANGSQLAVRIARSGCLSGKGRAVSCQAR